MNEFISNEGLLTLSGSVGAVALLVQFTLNFVKRWKAKWVGLIWSIVVVVIPVVSGWSESQENLLLYILIIALVYTSAFGATNTLKKEDVGDSSSKKAHGFTGVIKSNRIKIYRW